MARCLAIVAVGAACLRAAAQTAPIYTPPAQPEPDPDYFGWSGFKCADLRCDEATGALWVRQKDQQVGEKFQMRNTRGRERLDRSYCLVLAPTGDFARYARARARYRERHESAFWRERHYMYWSQTWLNGTADGEPVRSDGGSALSDPGAIAALGEDTYRGCLDRCGLTCAALAGDPARAEAPGAFDELYYSAFQQNEGFVRDRGGNERRPQWEDDDMTYDRYYPSACFTSNDFWEDSAASPAASARRGEEAKTGDGGDLAAAAHPDAGSATAAPKVRPRSALAQLGLLVWKASKEKSRDRAAIVKQLLAPSVWFVLIWLLYIMTALTGYSPQSKWSPKNSNWARKGGELHDYARGAILSHGTLETYLAQFAFLFLMQVVIVNLVAEKSARLLEAMKMAGLKEAVYWAAVLLVEGVVAGFLVALLVCVVAGPGLFRRAGHTPGYAGTILALHWMYVVALVVQCMWATTFITNNEAASIFAICAQLLGVIVYFVGAVKDGSSASIWDISPAGQRVYALMPQLAYGLLVDSYASHRVRKCAIRAAISPPGSAAPWDRSCDFGDDCFASGEYECAYGYDLEMDWRDAPNKRFRQLEEWAQSRGSTSLFCNGGVPWGDAYSYSYSCGDFADYGEKDIGCWVDAWSEYPSFYAKATGDLKGWRPAADWTGPLWGMLIADMVLYGLLAWYFNQVIPWSEYGTPKPFYFPLLPSYWLGTSRAPALVADAAFDDADDPARFEALDPGDAPRVEVRRLRKTFGEHKAVDGVSFGIRDSEIFCLLGHNGAGKTTTMAMISGLLPPDPPRRATDGATVFGYSIFEAGGMDSLRCLLGVCPQHDVLFPRLTLAEHVFFFSRLKGQSVANASREATSLLGVFHLGQRAAHLGAELSGGQKRKLSTSIALAGGSRFIILDEPTAGMDPRRAARALDAPAAEALGDRVAIMSSGKIRTCGTVPFLKRTFGKGYLLSATLKERAATADFGGFVVSDIVAGATLQEESLVAAPDVDNPLVDGGDADAVTERTYALPASEEHRLAALFDAIDGNMDGLAITSTALEPTTLETVFMIVGEDDTVHNVLAAGAPDESIYVSLPSAAGGAASTGGPRTSSRVWDQSLAIARMRLEHARNDVVILLAPLRGLEAMVCTFRERVFGGDRRPRPVNQFLGPHLGGARCTALVLLPAIVSIMLAGLCAGGELATGKQPRYSTIPNLIVAAVVGVSFIFVPGLAAEPLVSERANRVRNLLTISGLDYRAYWLGTLLADAALQLLVIACVYGGLAGFDMRYRMWKAEYRMPTLEDYFIIMDMITNSTSPDAAYIYSHQDDYEAVWDYYCDVMTDEQDCWNIKTKQRGWMTRTAWLWVLLPIFGIALSTFAHVGSYAFDTPTMCLGGFPILCLACIVLPLFGAIVLWLVFGGVMSGTSSMQMFTWNFGELVSVYAWWCTVASPVGALCMAFLRTGLRPFFMALGMLPRAQKILDTKNAPLWPAFWATMVVLLAQIVAFEAAAYLKDRMATRPLAYARSKFSKKRKLRLDEEVAKERNRVLGRLADAAAPADDDDAKPAAAAGCGSALKDLARQVLRDLKEVRAMVRNRPPEDAYPPELKEASAAAGLDVLELRKIYAPKRPGAVAVEAVQNVTFGVRVGEVFGLLGANGAGKTTTMSMVMRATEPTSGDAKIAGKSVLCDFGEASAHLGVVNQHNSLWPSLSCYDHCALFARLRRVGSEIAVRALVTDTLRRVELLGHAHKMAGRLSGGMKRKLCCAAALRNLWNLVKATMAGRAVVLTTHSMVEADVLCDRIGIMVKGQLECLGTPRQLKDQHASGYELAVKLDDRACASPGAWTEAINRVTAFATATFAPEHAIALAAADASLLTYEVSGASERGLLAKAFRAFDAAARADLGIAEFSVAQASMEKNALGRDVASMLQEEDEEDELEAELKAMTFRERTCCCFTRFAHKMMAKYHCGMCCTCCCAED
ncbi:ATPase [Aureococcus anophagefferens]|nr:ATPase [Aureococcus anophagefferens]